MKKVRIKSLPKAKNGMSTRGSISGGNVIYPIYKPNQLSEPKQKVNSSLGPVPEEDANLEAEKGETALIPDLNGLAAHFKVAGKKHYDGGTPLDLPKDSFIFSDTKKMKIKNEDILRIFGKTKAKNGGFTPADLAEKYDINEYRKVLADPYSDNIQRDTAEKMIANYNLKLAKLALVQESMKGFPNGIPVAALPYFAKSQIGPESVLPLALPENENTELQPDQEEQTFRYGGSYQTGGGSSNFGNPYYKQAGGDTKTDYYTSAYNLLNTTLTAPENEALRDKLYAQWKERPENKSKDLSKEQVIGKFLEAQKQIFTIQKSNPTLLDKEKLKEAGWDKGKKNERYKQEATKLGIAPLSEDDIKTFQSAYQVLSDLSDDPQFKPILQNFNLTPVGKSDQTYGKDSKPISPVDGWFGNTTVGQAVLPKTVSAPEKTIPGEIKQPDAIGDYTQKPLANTENPNFAPWWLQDVIKTAGAAGDFSRIKKRLPWAPTFAPNLPDPTFYDPTRELASNAEQMNIGTQGAGMFAGPQAYNSRFSEIQGQGAKNAADILSKYNNLNVGQANQFDAMKADIMNKAGMANTDMAVKLYDQTTLANQNFDNAKNMARQELRSSYIDAVTNRANAQVLNQLYPNYKIDPLTGGMMGFYKGNKLKPSAQSSDAATKFAELVNKYPNIDQRVLAKLYGAGDIGPDDETGPTPEAADWFKKYSGTVPTNYPNNQ